MADIDTTKFDKLTKAEKDEKTKYRGLKIKDDKDLTDLETMYVSKVKRIREIIAGSNDKENNQALLDKIERIQDKYAAVKHEQKLRKVV